MFDRFSGTIVDLHPLLHDSWLRRVSSDPALKTACVAINNQSVNQHHGFDAEAEFELYFTSVGSLEILVARKHGLITDEHGKAQPLYREESGSWTEFEECFSDERGSSEEGKHLDGRYEILSANLTKNEAGLEFYISDIVDYEGFPRTKGQLLCELRIFAVGVAVRGPTGDISIEEAVRLGSDYWNDGRRDSS